MASLLKMISNIPQDINHDIYQPVVRDVVQPAARATQPIQRALAPISGAINPVAGAVQSVQRFAAPISQGLNNAANFLNQHPLNVPIVKPIETHFVAPMLQNYGQTVGHTGQILNGHNPYHGTVPQIAGQVGNDVLNAASALPLGAAAGGVKAGVSGERFLPSLVKSGAINAGFGGGYGLAGAAQQKGATLKSVAKAGLINAGVSGAVGAGLPLGARGIRVGAKAALKTPAAIDKSLTPRTTLNDQRTLADYSNHLTGVSPLKPQQLSATISKVRDIAERHGQLAQVVKGSPLDKLNGVNNLLDTVVQRGRTQSQLGAVGKDVTSQEAKQLGKQLTTPETAPKVPTGKKNLGVVNTIQASKQSSAPLQNIVQGKYNPIANKSAMAAASKRIATDPNAAYQFAATTHSAEGNAAAIQIAKNLEAQGNHEAAANLMVAKAQQALQAGQGNQIYSLWDKLSPETVAQTAAKTIEKYNQTAKKPISQLTAEQYQNFVDQAKNIQSLPEGRAKGMATQNLLKQIGQLVPSSKTDKAFSLYRTGLLTGFRTPGKVLVSHAVSSGFEQAKNIPATIADKGISLVTGKRGLSFTTRGNLAGSKSGAFAAVDNLIHGYDAAGSGGIAHDFASSTHFNTDTLHGKVAQAYVDTIGHLHGSLYKPFYGAQHLNSLYDMALTNAKNQGLKGAERDNFVQKFVKDSTDASVKDQTQNAHADFTTPEGAAQRANAEAAYTTFQNPTALSKAAASVKRSTPGARYIVPFSQIPSSIASKVVDYSPIGAVKEAITQAKDGQFDQRALSQAIGRSSTGTGIAALGYHLYNSGNITTAYPTDKKEQAQWKLEGKQANSVLVGGKWRQLASLGPAGDTLAVGANVAEGMKGNKKTPGSLTNAAIQGGIGGINVLGNSPYLQGVQNVGAALSSPGTKSQKVAEGLAGGLIPTAVANIASASDSLQRQTNSPVDSVTNKIPGLREKNLPQVDVLGRNIPRAQGPLGTLTDPFYSTTAKTDPVTSELNRLNGTYNPATPSTITKNQSILGQKVNLNPQQLAQLQQQSGQPLSQQLSQLIQTPEYKGASDQTKAQAINNLTTQVRNSVKNSFATGQPDQAKPIVDTAKLSQSAQLTLAKDSFDKSGKSYQVVGDTVLRRDTAGNVTATPKIKFDYQVGSATLTSQKNAGDLSGWLNTAQSQLANIQKQLADPSTDPLEALTLQNDAATINKDIAKYQGYGSFTKGTSTGAKRTKIVAKVPNYKLASTRLKAPKVGKISVRSGSKRASAFRVPKVASAKTPRIKVSSKKIKVV